MRCKNMQIIYHSDLDGKASARLLLDYYRNINEEIQLIEANHGKELDLDVKKNEQIFIVDFSFKHPENMERLLETTSNITWIDHHKSAIEKYDNYENLKNLDGIRLSGLAGCELTWIYLERFQKFKNCETFDEVKQLLDDAPNSIVLIGDRDTWRWDHGDRTKFFNSGLEVRDMEPMSKEWEALIAYDAYQNYANQIIREGQTLEIYKEKRNELLRDKLSFETKFEGYDAIACNQGFANGAQLFGELADEYSLLILFCYSGQLDKWKVSLNSKYIDVSEIAKKYGGGGHAGAAGFECDELPFSPFNKTEEK